jgi:hypothetical protein
MIKMFQHIMALLLLAGPAVAQGEVAAPDDYFVVRPKGISEALQNPLKGFRSEKRDGSHPYATLSRVYIPWNEIENDASDGIEKIKAYCDRTWRDVEKHNIKVIPRVYLHWTGDKTYWPADLKTGDYESPEFQERLLRLIARLGECWDDDPRVAWVQMGLIGKWGEQHSPSPTVEMQQVMGKAFQTAFRKKKVLVRHPWQFSSFPVGVYWDSWAHTDQIDRFARGFEKMGDRWKTQPMEGETAYNWGAYNVQPGSDPNDTLTDPVHRNHLVQSLRLFHGSALGWVAEYNPAIPSVAEGADHVQRTMGYRFRIPLVRYPKTVTVGDPFSITVQFLNEGAAPIYYAWPVEVSLLDARTRQPVWRKIFQKFDIRTIQPGSHWSERHGLYAKPALPRSVKAEFSITHTLEPGRYILALAILEPAGKEPAIKFAIQNYFNGGRHPIGWVGVGTTIQSAELPEELFDDPATDRSIRYKLP